MEDRNTMSAGVFKKVGGNLEIVKISIPKPKQGWVRIKVHYCGVCHSDNTCKYGVFKNEYPRVSGHEVLGEIEKLGDGVDPIKFKIGQMVGVGWNGGNHCGNCRECLNNNRLFCKNSLVTGISIDGGYAEYIVVPSDGLVFIPEGMNAEETAPLLCAGVTVYCSIKNQNIKKSSLVGVLGIGGLGHLAIQFCKKMGYEVIAMSRGNSKEKTSRELGASHFVDIAKEGWVEQMKQIGSVDCILLTAPFPHLVQPSLEALGVYGKLLLLCIIPEPFSADSLTMISGNKSIVSWYVGNSNEIQDTLDFAHKNQIKPIIQTFQLQDVNEVLDKINEANFRSVIKIL
ncbi:hypothetical protein ACTFIR_012231 [Dictyostelium discoideum]